MDSSASSSTIPEQQLENYIKESIDHSLSLPVSASTLQLKLRAFHNSNLQLRDRCLSLQSLVSDKTHLINQIKAEASMNAQGMKKFVEENERLAEECRKLVDKCGKLEKECYLYERDREDLMDFGNEADQRARDALLRIGELEDQVGKLTEELRVFKETQDREVDSSKESTAAEENLLESVLDSLIKDGGISAQAFLEANSGHESHPKLLKMWNCLRPSSQKVLSLTALVKSLEKDKEHIRINLHKAEEEVNVLYEENNILIAENKLLRKIHKEKSNSASAGKPTSSSSAKSNKRKCY